tara:strand:+ start:2516 stop:2644 length:129 start_codon:yes stop_codon:yes gene_type:complete
MKRKRRTNEQLEQEIDVLLKHKAYLQNLKKQLEQSFNRGNNK